MANSQTYTAILMSANTTGPGTPSYGHPLIDGEPAVTIRDHYNTPDGERRVRIYGLMGTSNSPDLFEYALEMDEPDTPLIN